MENVFLVDKTVALCNNQFFGTLFVLCGSGTKADLHKIACPDPGIN
jgi:hypothetical protein